MKVLKFGGTSVSSVETVQNISSILKNTKENTIIVCSALSKVTNMLTDAAEKAAKGETDYIEIANEIEKRHHDFIDQLIEKDKQENLKEIISNHINDLKKILDAVHFLGELTTRGYYSIVSFGEKMSNAIIYRYLSNNNGSTGYLDSSQIIITKTINGKEQVNRSKTYLNIVEKYNPQYKITVAPGFISKSENGYATTLGRGGSDYTAALYAAALDASLLEIWTDVSGIYTADPRKVKNSYPLNKISYREALELSNFGAKVIYAPTILPILEKEIPMVIKNTFKPEDPGTYVSKETEHTENAIKAFSTMDNIAVITFSGTGLVGTTGIAGRLFTTLSNNNINIIIITQASSEQSICIAIESNDAEKATQSINKEFEYEIKRGTINETKADLQFSVLAMVGEGMKNAPGLAGKAFSALGKGNVNIHAIAQGSSELNVSIIIKKTDAINALNVLHDTFTQK
ncbi:MAG: aspartate kinase [Bacteroidales bacterium]|nr:aspartate kinase [Bacteroidales bacterium]